MPGPVSEDALCDVAIIGAGAAGAAAAWRLAARGLDVVCLEQGGWIDNARAPSLDADWERALQTRFHGHPGVRRLASDYPVDDADTPIRPSLYTGVGGSTLRWGAHTPRFHPSDFRVRTLDGVAADWPIGYDDLAPYYDINDQVSGTAGLAGDPANPPRSPRPLPPLPLGPGPERLARAFDALGWHWWPSDAGIASAPYGSGRLGCNNCGPCGLGCPRGARASADNTYWPLALAAGARLVTGARVLRVVLAAPDRAQGVLYRGPDGARRLRPARAVVLAASGLGTPRLLLASADAALGHPHGLANASGLVGRGLMHHPTAIVTGVFADRLDGYAGPFACSLCSQQFYETDPARGAVRGYQLQGLRGGGPVQTALGGYMARIPWGRGHAAAFRRQFARTVSLTVTAEDLPEDANRVDLHPGLADADGLAAPRLHYRLSENSRRLLDHGIARAEEVMRRAGAEEVAVNPLAAAAGFHFLGTARMGDDPARSVIDAACRAHTVPNLLVVDGGAFVTSAAVNPTPTIQAVAMRAADRLAADLLAASPSAGARA